MKLNIKSYSLNASTLKMTNHSGSSKNHLTCAFTLQTFGLLGKLESYFGKKCMMIFKSIADFNKILIKTNLQKTTKIIIN